MLGTYQTTLFKQKEGFRENILLSCHQPDLHIFCNQGQTVHTSIFPIALSSKWFLTMLGDILGTSSRLDNEVVTLCIPDFSREETLKAVEYMTTGVCYPENAGEMLQIQTLLDIFSELLFNIKTMSESTVIKTAKDRAQSVCQIKKFRLGIDLEVTSIFFQNLK